MTFDLRYISLGAGVQSSTLYLLAARGELEGHFDCAIFADTQQEPPWVMEQLAFLEKQGPIPIYRATAGDLGQAVRDGINTTGGSFSAVPFWVQGSNGQATPGRRQCTREYKIDVVKYKVRELLGLRSGQWAQGKFQVEESVGISVDEAHRARDSRYDWVTSRFPLLYERPMRRAECLLWLEKHGYPRPQKSACVFCPYRGDEEYLRWKREEPALFAQAVEWDELIRDSGTGKGQQYISRSLQPLRDLADENLAPDGDQLDLFGNDCSGMCGV